MIMYGAGNRYGNTYWVPDADLEIQLKSLGKSVTDDLLQFFGAKIVRSLDSLLILVDELHSACRRYKHHSGDCNPVLEESLEPLLTWYAVLCVRHVTPLREYQPDETEEGIVEQYATFHIDRLAGDSLVLSRPAIATIIDAARRLAIAVLGRNEYTVWVIQCFAKRLKTDIIDPANCTRRPLDR